MMKTMTSLCGGIVVFSSAFALGQNKPVPVSRDGGLPLVRVATDAGVPSAPEPLVPNFTNLEVERLKREVNELKLRVVEVEKQHTKFDALSADFEKLSKRFDTLKSQTDAALEAEERRAEAERTAVSRRALTAEATNTVNGVLMQLSTGDTRGVERSLMAAEAAMGQNAQREMQQARASLQRSDLNSARLYLMMALMESQKEH